MEKNKYQMLFKSGTTLNLPIFLESTSSELGVMVGFDGEVEQIEQLCNFTYTSSGNVVTVYNSTNTNVINKVVDATFSIDWGDSVTTSIGILENKSHTYSSSGKKTVTITMNSPWRVQKLVKVIPIPKVINNPTNLGTMTFNVPYTSVTGVTQDYNNDYDYNGNQYTGTTTFLALGTSRIIEKKKYGSNTYDGVTSTTVSIEGTTYSCNRYVIDGLTYLDLSDGSTYITGNTATFTSEAQFIKKLTRNEHFLGFVSDLQIFSDVFVERGKMGVSEFNLRLSEIDNLGELDVYGNGFFLVKKQ